MIDVCLGSVRLGRHVKREQRRKDAGMTRHVPISATPVFLIRWASHEHQCVGLVCGEGQQGQGGSGACGEA
eukprot:366400-Chlamydomonas_euryale.AAC.16